MARTGDSQVFSVHPATLREAQLLRLFRGLSPRYQEVVLVVAESHADRHPDTGAVVVPFPGMRP